MDSTPHTRLSIRLPILAALVFLACTATAWTSPCVDCGEVSDEDTALLQKWDLDPASYTVVFSWQERAHNGSDVLIKGMRIAPNWGGEPYDVYADALGTQLSPGKLAALHIAPKDWSVQSLSVAPEFPSARKTTAMPVAIRVPTLVNTPKVKLPTLDHGKLLAEDAAVLSETKAARRIGVFQEIPGHLWLKDGVASLGSWEVLSDGRQVWATTIQAPGARGQRLRVTGLALPKGGEVFVQNAAVPSEVFGPFTSLPPGGELWTPTCFSDHVIVMCVLPADADIARVALRVDRIIHLYADLTAMPFRMTKADTCNLAIADYPEWADIGSGVGGIGSVTSRGYIWCTGSLIADTLPGSQAPLFLTANHCVGSQGRAESIEVYWLYDSGTLSPWDVPRTTGGADLLVTSPQDEGNDVSLLRLRNLPPTGLALLGWTTASALQTEVVTIHHPQGDYKRISFGNVIEQDAGFHTVQWVAGTTEPGSSGSPLLTPEGRIVGQLYGGYASCAQLLSPDYYGRFDAGWPVLQSWLTEVALPWDVDGSGRIDAVDVQLVARASLRGPVGYDCDVDKSGRIDAVDIQLVILALLNEIVP